jgi:hypothetical protein
MDRYLTSQVPNSQLLLCERSVSVVTGGRLEIYRGRRCPVCGGEIVKVDQMRGKGAEPGKCNLRLACRKLDCAWKGMIAADSGIATVRVRRA